MKPLVTDEAQCLVQRQCSLVCYFCLQYYLKYNKQKRKKKRKRILGRGKGEEGEGREREGRGGRGGRGRRGGDTSSAFSRIIL